MTSTILISPTDGQLVKLRSAVRKAKKNVFEPISLKLGSDQLDKKGGIKIVLVEKDLKKVDKAIEKKTGVVISFDSSIQTMDVVNAIAGTLHSKSEGKGLLPIRRMPVGPHVMRPVVGPQGQRLKPRGQGVLPVNRGRGVLPVNRGQGVLPIKPRGKGIVTRTAVKLGRDVLKNFSGRMKQSKEGRRTLDKTSSLLDRIEKKYGGDNSDKKGLRRLL